MKPFPQKPSRWQDDHSVYFLTFCTFQRLKYLHKDQVPEFLIKELQFYSKKIRELISYTIMPDHIHLLMETETVQAMSAFLRDFKKYTSVEIKRLIGVEERYVWQSGTMDHHIRTSLENEDFDNHLKYILFNSWKHLGVKPKDFPYHNYCEIVKKGWIENDFFDFNAPKEFDRYE